MSAFHIRYWILLCREMSGVGGLRTNGSPDGIPGRATLAGLFGTLGLSRLPRMSDEVTIDRDLELDATAGLLVDASSSVSGT